MARGDIVEGVVRYLVTEIVDNPEEATLEVVDEGGDRVTVEVHTAKSDMGRVIGRRGRVARAIRTLAQAAADEEGLEAGVEFID